jgi:hypothetical protein
MSSKPTKATKARILQRVEEVLRIRLDGAEFWDLREYAREKEKEVGSAWELPKDGKPLTDPTLWRYIRQADKLISESCRSSRKKLLRNHLAQRRNLYAKAALAIKKDEAELLDLYPPKKIAPTTPDGKDEYNAGSFSDDEVAAILARLASRLGLADPGPGGHEQANPA